MRNHSEQQDDLCSCCHDLFEIVKVKFGFSCVSFVSACPNCGLLLIGRTREHNKFWLPLSSAMSRRRTPAIQMK
jgi:predicted RNA-binding Zn-ribbon protein involved in translation (DUF1610 family)